MDRKVVKPLGKLLFYEGRFSLNSVILRIAEKVDVRVVELEGEVGLVIWIIYVASILFVLSL